MQRNQNHEKESNLTSCFQSADTSEVAVDGKPAFFSADDFIQLVVSGKLLLIIPAEGESERHGLLLVAEIQRNQAEMRVISARE